MAGLSVLQSHADGLTIGDNAPLPMQLTLAFGTFTAGHGLLTLSMLQVRESRKLRTLVAATISAICLFAVANSRRDTFWGVQFALYMFGLLMQSNMLLLLIPTVVPQSISLSERLRRVLRIEFTGRLSYGEIQKLPIIEANAKMVDSTQVKMLFLRERLAVMTWSSLLYYLFSYPLRPALLSFDEIVAAGAGMSTFQRMTTPNLPHLRSLLLTEALGDLQQFWILQVIHGIVAINAVFIFGSNSEEWPPVFGDIREAYTMGRVYSHWWHRFMRKILVENGKMVGSWMVFLPLSARDSRYMAVVMTFVVSGAIHAVSLSPSNRCLDLRCLVYFFLLAIVVPLEELLQLSYHYMQRRSGIRNGSAFNEKTLGLAPVKEKASPGWKFLGYLWVLSYKSWIVPMSVSSTLICLNKS